MDDQEHNAGLPPLPSLGELIDGLGGMGKEQEEFLHAAIPPDRIPKSAEDHLVIAALRRSIDNTWGILAMADQRNVFCGMPIVRFQLDTAMCLFARTMVDDVEGMVTHLMNAGQLRNWVGRTGKRLTDKFLYTELTRKHPHADHIYHETSGYVHFSTQHLHRILDLERFQRTSGTEIVFKSPDDITVGWSEEEVPGALVAFMWATEAIIQECRDWRVASENRHA